MFPDLKIKPSKVADTTHLANHYLLLSYRGDKSKSIYKAAYSVIGNFVTFFLNVPVINS